MEQTEFMKRLYPPKMFYRLLKDLISSRGSTKSLPSSDQISRQFIERIMIAVTQVNGCRYCSYFHTRVALKAGMNQKEIQKAFAGNFEDAPEEELTTLYFAQHYAEESGNPAPETVACMINDFGEKKTKAIIAYIRAIMVGNAWGNMVDSLKHRLTGKSYGKVTFIQEIGVILGPLWMIPAILIQSLFRKLF